MNTKDLIHKEEVFSIVGVAMEVLNALGHGFHEKPYENAMVVEFGLRGIAYRQQPEFPILFKNVKVSSYIPDLIAFEKVIIDTKVIPAITDLERGKMLNYLRVTGLRVGLIINFQKAKLE